MRFAPMSTNILLACSTVVKDLPKPNGIPFHQTRKLLCVSNRKRGTFWMHCDVAGHGFVSGGRMARPALMVGIYPFVVFPIDSAHQVFGIRNSTSIFVDRHVATSGFVWL